MKRFHSFAWLVPALMVALTLVPAREGQGAAPTEGVIAGQVLDLDSGQPVAGVTVVASGPEGDTAALTDAKGRYQFRALPIGRYTIRFHRNEVLAEREATVSVDQTVRVNMRLPAVPAQVEVVAAPYSAPAIDVGSSRIGATFGSDFIDGIPNAGADVASLMQKAPGAYDDTPPLSVGFQGNPGVSLSGGTGADNAYYLEGLNVTALRDGMLATNLHVAFLEEVEVVSAGFGAEYGRALGGVVNMALKSGTNEWKGSAFSWVQPGWMSGSQQQILSRSTVLTGTTEPDYTTQMGAEVGGPIIKDKLFIWMGYVPEIGRSNFIQYADRLVERDGQLASNPDGSPVVQPLYSRVITGESTTHNYAGKLTWRIRPDHTVSLSLVGIRKDQEYMRDANMDLMAGMTHEQSSRQDIIAHWQSAFFQRHWRIDATVGLHTENYSDRSPYGDVESANNVTWKNNPSLAQFNPLVASLCQDDPVTGFQRCPVQGYQSGGYGNLTDVSAIRLAGQIKSTNIFSALGLHELKYGIDYELNQYDEKSWYSGPDGARGLVTALPLSAPGLEVDSLYGLAGYQDSIEAKNRAYNTGAFIQESYLPLSNLTVNVGLRWEAQRLTDYMGNTAISISDSFAPRIGVVYDPTKEGRSKIFAHYGQYYESIPADLANRDFGGKGSLTTYYDPSCQAQSWTSCTALGPRSTSFPNYPVQPNIKGSYNNEIVVGGQYQYWQNLVVGASLIRRWLGRAIEDGGGSFANPDAISMVENPPGGATLPDGTPVPKPQRTYTALQLTATKRWARNWFFAGAYTYSRTMGNYAGLYDASLMQLNPNNSMQYDISELTANTYGPLPNDRPHLIHMDGYYRFIWGQHSFSPGFSFVGRSGQPISPLGTAPYDYSTFIFSRGSAGRTPFVTQLDMHLSYRTKLSTALSAEAFIDIFNVLNQKTVLTVDSLYTPDQVMPVTTPGAPATVANNDGSTTTTPVKPNPNYLHATSYQAPISGRLGMRVWF
jgi:Carboxypeptidase regulatory-like domain